MLIYYDFHTQQSLKFTENGQKKNSSEHHELLRQKSFVDERLIQIDRSNSGSNDNGGIQKSVSEHTTHSALKQIG